MKITDLIIDPKSLGSKLWLVEVSPAYEYQNNRRTDTVLGYRYAVALPEKINRFDIDPDKGIIYGINGNFDLCKFQYKRSRRT